MSLSFYSINKIIKILSVIALVVTFAACGAGKSSVASKQKQSSAIQDDLLAYSKKYLGRPYRYAGKGPNAFDCSGFTSFVFKNFGYNLSSSSAGQDRQVPTIERKEKLSVGDLVFFEGRRRNGVVGHVGIVSEISSNGNFKFIHASTTSGVIISNSTEPYYASRYLRGGRVLEDNASYVTKQPEIIAQSKANQQKVTQTAIKPKEITTQNSNTTEVEKNETITLVQTDPLKNPPVKESGTSSINKVNSEIALRKETDLVPPPSQIHTVLAGETLYSISKKYGCSIEQLKTWNPQLNSMLKAGDNLTILFE